MTDTSSPNDISLLLRVYGEQRWLLGEVFPVLREAERPGAIAEQELAAALAYLEVLWSQACRLAGQSDLAAALLDAEGVSASEALTTKARRYYAAVVRLRKAMRARIERATSPLELGLAHEHAHG
jgi:hypothetical protein